MRLGERLIFQASTLGDTHPATPLNVRAIHLIPKNSLCPIVNEKNYLFQRCRKKIVCFHSKPSYRISESLKKILWCTTQKKLFVFAKFPKNTLSRKKSNSFSKSRFRLHFSFIIR
jgi:hypothetical protein